MKPLGGLHLRLLGRFALSGDEAGAEPLRITARKSCGLIAYLAMSPQQTASREELATLLWGGCSDQQARQSLRQALALLRKALGSPNYFVAGPATIQLQPGLWSTDRLEFERLSRSAEAADLKRAAELFGGEFLTGLNLDEESFDEWLRSQRQRSQTALARLCETVVQRPDLVIDCEDALAVTEKLQALDPLREDWHRWSVTLRARYGRKHEALAQAEAFAKLLKRELDIAPEAETQALAERIRDGSLATRTSLAANIAPAEPATEIFLPPIADQVSAGTPAASQSNALPATPRWKWPVRAAAALALLAFVVAGYELTGTRAIAPRNTATINPEQLAQAPASSDPWRSPALPSRSATDAGRSQFIIPIAVLPFATYGDTGGSTQLAADMITEDLTNALSRVSQIRVISRQTMRGYQGKPVDIAAIGAELQVRYILEGSIRLQDDKLRVNYELTDPSTRMPVWSGQIDRDGGDLRAVQDEIVGRLARELQVEIYPIESERHSADQNADVLAYRGWSVLLAAISHINLERYETAKALFQQALASDPRNLSAEFGLGVYHTNVGVQRLVADSDAHLQKGLEIIREVVRRDPTNARAYYHLGVALQGIPLLPEALDALEQAVRLNPSSALAHAHIGHVLTRMARPDEGIEHIHYAMRLSPKDPAFSIWLEFAGAAELERGHYPEAIENFRRSAEISPNYPRPWAGLAEAYALAGKLDEAQSYTERLRTLSPNLSPEELFKRFVRRGAPHLEHGLRLALAPHYNGAISHASAGTTH